MCRYRSRLRLAQRPRTSPPPARRLEGPQASYSAPAAPSAAPAPTLHNCKTGKLGNEGGKINFALWARRAADAARAASAGDAQLTVALTFGEAMPLATTSTV